MKERRMIFFVLILSFILGVTMVGTGRAQEILTLYLDPTPVLGMSAPGDTFDVYLTARYAVDLFLTDVQISFDPAILQVFDDPVTPDLIEGIDIGDTAPYMEVIWVEKLDNTIGWLEAVSGRPVGVKTGLTGTVQLAKITFVVQAVGSSALYLHDSVAKIVGNIPIDHATEDGFFASTGWSHYAFACNSTGAQRNVFEEGETVYVVGGAFAGTGPADIYVVPNATWTDGDPIGTSVLPVVTVELLRKATEPHLKHYLPITALGVPPAYYYDIVVDYDQDGVYDAGLDAIDDVSQRPGFTGPGTPPVQEFPLGMVMPLALLPVLVYVWWTRKRKNINSN